MKLIDHKGMGTHPKGVYLTAGSAGYATKPIKHLVTSAASAAAGTTGARMSVSYPTLFGKECGEGWLHCEDYLNGAENASLGGVAMNRVEFRMDDDSSLGMVNSTVSPLDVYSLRMYLHVEAATPLPTYGPQRYLSFVLGDPGDPEEYGGNWITEQGNTKYAYSLCSTDLQLFLPQTANRVCWYNGFSDGYAQAPNASGTARLLGARRLEMQVDANRDPKVVARMYFEDDAGVPLSGLSFAFNPTSVTMDRIFIGDDDSSGNHLQEKTSYGNIELHDDYDLGGQFADPGFPTAAAVNATGTPVIKADDPDYNYEWFEFDKVGNTLLPLTHEGVWNGTITDTTDTKFSELNERRKYVNYNHNGWYQDEPAPVGAPLAWSTDSIAGASDASAMSIDYPSGTPPVDGWPIVFWAHSGFFVAGTYREIPRGLVEHLTHHGVAVASVSYIKGAEPELLVHTGTPYPAYPAAGTYQTFITDYKNAVNYMRRKGLEVGIGDGTVPIDTTRMIFTGYSAGGYVALGAATSRDLADDGSGRSLTVADSPSNTRVPGAGGDTTPPDPIPLGAYAWSGPTDLRYSIDNDATHPRFGIKGGLTGVPSMGLIRAAAYSFRGLRCDDNATFDADLAWFDNTDIANFIDKQDQAGLAATHVPMIGYSWGTSDALILEEHIIRLEAAMAAAGRPFERHDNYGVIHDNMDSMLDWNRFRYWLDNVPGFLAG